MLRRSDPARKKPPPFPALDSGNGARLLNDIEVLSKALTIQTKPSHPKPLPPPPRSVSAGKSDSTNHRHSKSKDKTSTSSSSSSIWGWKALKSLSHLGHRRIECRFTLRVRSISNLPSNLNGFEVWVCWRRIGSGSVSRTKAIRVSKGAVEFEEEMAHRCSVYACRSGQHNSAKYESRQFVILVVLAGTAEVELGKHRVDLTRILPLTLEEFENETCCGEWSTDFKLSGKGRGGVLNVSFGYSVVKDGLVEGDGNRREAMEGVNVRLGRVEREDGWQGSRRRDGSIPRRSNVSKDRLRPTSRSVEDVRVLHEVLPVARSKTLPDIENVEQEDEAGAYELEPQVEDLKMQVDGMERNVLASEEFVQGDGKVESANECEEQEFTVVEKGVGIWIKDRTKGNKAEDSKHEKTGKTNGMFSNDEKQFPRGKELSGSVGGILSKNELVSGESVSDELESAFNNLSLVGPVCLESQAKTEVSEPVSHGETKFNYKTERMSKSLDLEDDVTESIANEFLSMLGADSSSLGLGSESEVESPRERLLKEFERSMNMGIIESPRDSMLRKSNLDSVDHADEFFGPDVGNQGELSWEEDFDLTSIVDAAEAEHHIAAQAMKSKTRAKLLEDAEAEALMNEWGLNEKAFENSPLESRCGQGFGSPIDLPPEDPLELPPLGDGLGPFVQTKDGGFLKSMSPALFKNAKNNGSLVMQVSSPVVVPAAMGSGIMDLLQHLASVGIEKLSMQASKLMPLEDITGKTMPQVAWDAVPSLEANESQDFVPHLMSEVGSEHAGSKSDKQKSYSKSRDNSSEYVSLEDLAPYAMDKIEALSIEGLRIQSGMSDDEALSNISPQSIGNISAFEGKVAKDDGSLGLDGAAGLQLLDVKDNGSDVDGLMGLALSLDEWMRLDSGSIDEDDLSSDRTSKILAAHHAKSLDLISGGSKGDKRGGKNSSKRWGLLGNNFTVALMVQLRDPMRNYEPVGTPMLSLIQVERVVIPPKPKVYRSVFVSKNSEQDVEDSEDKIESIVEDRKEKEIDTQCHFKIAEVHIAGLKTEPEKKKPWGNPTQQQSGSRWLLANGMGKTNKHPFTKSKPGDSLWSVSSCIHGTSSKWNEFGKPNAHTRNPNVIFPSGTSKFR